MKLILQKISKRTISIQNRRCMRSINSRQKKSRLRRGDKRMSQKLIKCIKCPFAINITSKANRRHTLKFFEQVRYAIITENRPIEIDLSNLKFMSPNSALLMIAEFDRAKRLVGKDFRVTLTPSNTHRMNAVLDQIGFSAICDTKLSHEVADQASDELVRHWRYATGERINDQTTKAFEGIQGRIATSLHDGMWKGISEAIGNACLHAYLERRGTDPKDLENKRWWMLSHEKDGRLSVTVADLGIGIPRSLPLTWSQSTLSKVLDRLIGGGEDVRAIKAAMEIGATRTGEQHRGKGLPQIWHDLRADKNASISIYSNKGSLGWTGEGNIERSHEFPDSIFGTVISWTVPVSERKNV